MIGFGQNVNIPDANFKAYLVGNTDINTNGDTEIQVSEATAFNGTTICSINCSNMNIADLTGIEYFTSLCALQCSGNQLTSLDVSQNTALEVLSCGDNQLTSLNVSSNTALQSLNCDDNQLTSLDVSSNTALQWLYCQDNQLTSLDMRNGNNYFFTHFYATNNFSLSCIDVDTATWSTANWTVANNNIDAQHYFSTNCSTTDIEEHTRSKELLKVIDLLGRETKQTNQPLFYIYDDGTVEKRIVIE